MNAIETVMARMSNHQTAPALYWREKEYSYAALLENVRTWSKRLAKHGIKQGTVCGLLGDFSPQTCALFFALM